MNCSLLKYIEWEQLGQTRDGKFEPFKCQSHKMVKHTQTIRRQEPTKCLSAFDHFVGLALKGLRRRPSEILYRKVIVEIWNWKVKKPSSENFFTPMLGSLWMMTVKDNSSWRSYEICWKLTTKILKKRVKRAQR